MAEKFDIDGYLQRRDEARSKHRYMTAGEYAAWCNGGDAISSPCENNPFPGGITIDFRSHAIIGRT